MPRGAVNACDRKNRQMRSNLDLCFRDCPFLPASILGRVFFCAVLLIITGGHATPHGHRLFISAPLWWLPRASLCMGGLHESPHRQRYGGLEMDLYSPRRESHGGWREPPHDSGTRFPALEVNPMRVRPRGVGMGMRCWDAWIQSAAGPSSHPP